MGCLHYLCSAVILLTPIGSRAQIPSAEGTWTVDWGDRWCSLLREAQGSNSVTMISRSYPDHMTPELLLLHSRWTKDPLNAPGKVELKLHPKERTVVAKATPVLVGEKHALQLYGMGADFLDRFGASSGLRAEYRGKELISFGFTDALPAIAELKRCSDNLLTSLGIDPRSRARLMKMPARRNKSPIFRDSDYPRQALRRHISGTVVIRYTVGVEGLVTACVPVVSSGQASMDEVTCKSIVSRARYEPGLDAEGKPTPVDMVATVSYQALSGP